VRLAGYRVVVSAELAALLVAADVDIVALSVRRQLLILLRAAKRCATEMTMNLD
jgi:hypothetical protein